MSGIVGFINFNREPADPETLLQLSNPLQGRAPDGTNTWCKGSTGLAHALLAITNQPVEPLQPGSLDGNAWITSDAHLYDKQGLIQSLRSTGIQVESDVPESNLLLLAYKAFGDPFARKLTGDFALAIWDESEKKLICARDHLGVRPLFYTYTSEVFAFASNIEALLAHPLVDAELDENHIADFLLFGVSIEQQATAYKNIKRFPSAHYMVVDSSGIQLHKYWSPSLGQTIRYSRDSEYSDHFHDLFSRAVTGRVPDAPLALELTGGMDSSSIAAVAAPHAKNYGQVVTAYTNTCQDLIPEDKEGQFAKMIASHLNIPVQLIASEDYPLFDRFQAPELQTSEPFGNPDLAQHYEKMRRIRLSGGRVLLTGQMGDTLFAGSISYFPQLLKAGRLIRLARELAEYRKNTGSLSGTGLRWATTGAVGRYLGKKPWQPELPSWIHPDFANRVNLQDRWNNIWGLWGELNDIAGQLSRPWFCHLFENYEVLDLPLVVRHPFSDIRLVEFMLRLPFHMHADKRVLREAMRGRLPPEILSRPKEGLPGDLRKAKMLTGRMCDEPGIEVVSEYIDCVGYRAAREKFIREAGNDTTWSTWLINYPIALAYWMNNNDRNPAEDHHVERIQPVTR